MTADPPDIHRLMAALEATWPPAETVAAGGFRVRRGAGGGKRVSSASPLGGGTWDVGLATAAMAGWGQGPLFQLMPDLDGSDAELDRELAATGYAIVDPTVLYVARTADLKGDEAPPVAHASDFLPVLLQEIWSAGGIGRDRLAVMDRVAGPSMRLLGRAGDRPAGMAFVAIDADIAMIHAIEVRAAQRRKGVARQLIHAGARFAERHRAPWFALAVTEANGGARALYEGLGMTLAGRYHYRMRQES